MIVLNVFFQAFASLLKRDVAINFKAKGNPLVSVLACNVLATAFQDEENWPDNFVKVRKDCSFHPFNFLTKGLYGLHEILSMKYCHVLGL